MADIGLMMDSEKEILETVEAKTAMTNYWIPLTWATNIINRARREKLISNDHMVQTILLEMSDMRYRLGSLIGYDNVNIPILYSQVGIAFTFIHRHSGGVLHALSVVVVYRIPYISFAYYIHVVINMTYTRMELKTRIHLVTCYKSLKLILYLCGFTIIAHKTILCS